jgi:glycosyltransferase involved in cell wall biosynthesis
MDGSMAICSLVAAITGVRPVDGCYGERMAMGENRRVAEETPGRDAVLVVIPAFNEEASIGSVIDSVRRHMPAVHILVVDDGSCDGTSRRVREAGADLLRLPCNLGVGAALEVALRHAETMGYAYALRLDADGQHDPRDALRLLGAARRGEADVLIGSRFLDAGSNGDEASQGKRWRHQTAWARVLGIKVFASLVSILIGQPISDPTCGLRCFNRAAIRYLAYHHPQDYPEVESMVVLHRAGFRLKELPVVIYPRTSGVSSISTWKAVYYVFRVMLAASIAAIRTMPNGQEEEWGRIRRAVELVQTEAEKFPEEEPHVA